MVRETEGKRESRKDESQHRRLKKERRHEASHAPTACRRVAANRGVRPSTVKTHKNDKDTH
jgi:hypothetical protein